MRDEGYIKFDCRWAKLPMTIPPLLFSELNGWRDRLYRLGLIGAYPDGVGFGNLSARAGYQREFWITSSSTGHLDQLTPEHYARVTDFNVSKNKVWCWGGHKASSETMSHAVLYCCDRRIKAVAHVHNKLLWERLVNHVPTTAMDVLYGTPEMAYALQDLYNTTDLPQQKILVMAGHQDGIVSFGNSIAEASERVINLYKQLRNDL